jgi:hypothetical protein
MPPKQPIPHFQVYCRHTGICYNFIPFVFNERLSDQFKFVSAFLPSRRLFCRQNRAEIPTNIFLPHIPANDPANACRLPAESLGGALANFNFLAAVLYEDINS